MTQPLIHARDMRKTYGMGETAQEVLKGVDLGLAPASLTALIGRSGSGKSTLLLILGTLMAPSGGKLELLGRDVTAPSERDLTDFRNQHIGFVFQFHHLLPDLTAEENVMFPTAVRLGRETRAARQRAGELLARVGLADRAQHRATALSGGQKQRVAIARALMNRPELVLGGEPTGNRDRENADQVMALFREINQTDGTAFLISTHDEKIAVQCRDEVHIDDGRIVDSAIAKGP
ncbi:MAG TPA: ABC transporter ATP-binding protein [Aliiroseovarius sp.]|nr:ABC transporter ATP-binding protein [Aliiroseovarius sp.]